MKLGGLIGVAAGCVAAAAVLKSLNGPRKSFRDKVVLITGGSRGLGLALARRFAAEGSKLVLCARSASELNAAHSDLARFGTEVITVVCDVTDHAEVKALVAKAVQRFGRLDVLVNNAGVIKVGPVKSMTQDDFAEAMELMFWGVVHTTLAGLPYLERSCGTIVNITSVGGKVTVPHLLPYCCAKFAAVAFSDGLRAELRGTGVNVLTVAPGLMRTGSHVNVKFKGNAEGEAAWFGLGASTPGLAMTADRAARQIVDAAARGKGEAILGLPAQVLTRFHALFPDTTSGLLSIANGLLPHGEQQQDTGWREAAGQRKWLEALTFFGTQAARDLLQPGASRS